MTSGFVTNDGKDLDSRYLGINAKAVSAKTADNVTNKGSLLRNGSVIRFTIKSNGSYTATKAGICTSWDEGSGTSRGVKVNNNYAGKAVFVQSGDTITVPFVNGTSYTEDLILIPIKIG